MFSTIIAAITEVAGGIVDAARGVALWAVKGLVKAVASILGIPSWVLTGLSYLCSGVVALWAITEDAFEWAAGFLLWMLDKVSAVPSSNFALPGGWSSALATANTFIPLDEMFAMTSAFLTIFLACMLIRIGKSLIPGL
jgi:hypothetical protein